ncbi:MULTISPECIES: hypothetical protein [Pseudomonas]|uniref:hypothetical protein n=1 Tax=Pseudomonas TaxID=286 RepID=UPI000CFDFB5D|nr:MULTISPECIES: hypothetical protein [Pseudomonas]PQZ83955.1 hypothetical protein CQ048_25330 [Pseudomonas trivialis]PRB20014.1 hypothetical protein CQ041_25395 [Pseudomonas sp. MYb60]
MGIKFTEDQARVTDQEAVVVGLLAEAWNEFLKLPIEHPMEQREFCTAIHSCQDKILARGGRRVINTQAGD